MATRKSVGTVALVMLALSLVIADGAGACPCVNTTYFSNPNFTGTTGTYEGVTPFFGSSVYEGHQWNFRPWERDYSIVVTGSVAGTGSINLSWLNGTAKLYVDGVLVSGSSANVNGNHTFVVEYIYNNPGRRPDDYSWSLYDSGIDVVLAGSLAYTDPLCNPPTQVPEPSTLVLLGAGLIGVGVYARRRTRK